MAADKIPAHVAKGKRDSPRAKLTKHEVALLAEMLTNSGGNFRAVAARFD